MEVTAYDYVQNKIENLSNIELYSTADTFYNYNEINFLCKLNKESSNLVVIFHGASMVTGKTRIVFRGYNFTIPGADILSISDSLLNIYMENQFFWFLSTDKYKLHKKYRQLIQYFVDSKKYNKIIFTGTSAGGYPSLYFASYFNKIALISNPQIYLEKYNGFKLVGKNIKKFGDKFGYRKKQIEKNINERKPEKIVLYCNKKDSTYKEHVLPFVDFMKESSMKDLLELKYFEPQELQEGKIHHQVLFPKNRTHNYVLIECLNSCK